ncbi:MAG: LysM peptidoglycan-binding domain-containing protein [Muribaculaceae bacterium]|nr:LysM peptidoglycan-binding domain-containing protein [Muribaculaceae bacterium]
MKTNSYKSYLTALLLAMSVGAGDMYAVNVNLPVVELLGNNYYVYKAKKGDSLFGIARMFGWDDETLKKLNPSAVSPLQKGMKIYYPAQVKSNANVAVSAEFPEAGELRHTVKRGETVYAISNMYGVAVDSIYSLNPESRNGIKAGETLLIRQEETSGPSDRSIYYTVRDGDTLYGLSKDYGVSVAAILKSNPGIDEANLKSGINIKIPPRGTGLQKTARTVEESTLDSVDLQKAGKNESWNSIAARNGVSVDLLKDANPEIREIKNKDVIAVPKVETVAIEKEIVERDPREESSQGVAEIYQDVHGLNDQESEFTVKAAVVAEDGTSKKDIEFIRGFLAGLESQKGSGYKIEFRVIDGKASSETVITSLDAFKPSVVFLTADHDVPSYLGEYASVSQTPVVNAFDVKSIDYTSNPYVVQLQTPSSLFNENVASYVFDRFSDRTLVFTGEPDSNDLLAESLTRLWSPSSVVKAGIEDITPDFFAEEGRYLVYGYTVKKAEVTELLEKAASCRTERPLADISVLGRPNLIVYEETLDKAFHDADAMIPSRFYIDKESSQYNDFIRHYKDLFGHMPAKTIPVYAASGYDAAVYFLPELARTRGDINKIRPSVNSVQSDFDLRRTSNWSGFLNPPVFLVEFTPFGTVNKNVIIYGE